MSDDRRGRPDRRALPIRRERGRRIEDATLARSDDALADAADVVEQAERFLSKIRCPFCDHGISRVTNSRPNTRHDGVWRRRECVACGRRFTTEETIRGKYASSRAS